MVTKKKVSCPTCGGKGYINRPQRVKCDKCAGMGWRYVKA